MNLCCHCQGFAPVGSMAHTAAWAWQGKLQLANLVMNKTLAFSVFKKFILLAGYPSESSQSSNGNDTSMTPHDNGQTVTDALRGLCVGPAAIFGNRLLNRSKGQIVSFPAFVETAREMVASLPEECATYLAALIALDMREIPVEQSPAQRDRPSDN